MVGGTFRGVIKVLCQMQRSVRNTLESGHGRDVDDVRLSLALDDIDAIEVDAERPATAQGDLAQLRRRREGFPGFFLLGQGGENIPYSKKPAPHRAQLSVAALRRP